MKMIAKSGWIDASPDAVWRRIAALDWQTWDPDLARVENIEGGMVDGGRCQLVMNNGVTMPIRFTRLDDARRVEWTGTCWGGTLKATGIIELMPKNSGTAVTYHFALHGLMGRPMQRLMRKTVDHGTAGCVAGLEREVPRGRQTAAVDGQASSVQNTQVGTTRLA